MAGLSLRGGMPLLKLPNGSVSSVLSQSYSSEVNTVCPGSSDPFYIVNYYINYFLDILYHTE